MAGAVVFYTIALLIDVNRIEKTVEKWEHILGLSKKDVHKVNGWFSKYGVWTVFFCRFIRKRMILNKGYSNYRVKNVMPD